MWACISAQSGLPQSTWGCGQLLVGSMVAALILLSVIVGFEVSAAATRSEVATSTETSGEIVNRAHKGDRLLATPADYLNAVNQLRRIKVLRAPALDLKLADGCESLVSPLAHAGLAKVAGRCVS
jgi:hypothetical protein